jgi:hypothetical protein
MQEANRVRKKAKGVFVASESRHTAPSAGYESRGQLLRAHRERLKGHLKLVSGARS